MTEQLTKDQIATFLALFDAYAAARAELKCTPDEGPAEHDLISHCLSLWRQLCDCRNSLEAEHK